MTQAEVRMTKAKTKSQQRRDRKRASRDISLPGGEKAKPRPTQGVREPDGPADDVAIRARLRRLGLRETEANRDMARSQMAGCEVGRRLLQDASITTEARADLWQAVTHMRRVVAAYDRAIGSPQRHAKCMRVLLPSDEMSADASSPAVDTRTDEEKQRLAVAAWTTMHGWLAYTDSAARSACLRAVVDEPSVPVSDWRGVVLALRCVADGVKGRRVHVRARD